MELNQQQVEALIPHRKPFLFVRCARIQSRSEISGVAFWDATNPLIAGHFPGYPVVPGVLIAEAAAQLSGVLMASQADTRRAAANLAEDAGLADPLGMLVGIRRASFHRPVYPEQPIHYTVTLGQTVGGMVSVLAEASDADGHKVFKGEVHVAVVDKSRLPVREPVRA